MSTSKKIIIAGTAAFVLICLWPPVKASSGTLTLRHTFLFSGSYGHIEIINLIVRWCLVAVPTAVLSLVFKNN